MDSNYGNVPKRIEDLRVYPFPDEPPLSAHDKKRNALASAAEFAESAQDEIAEFSDTNEIWELLGKAREQLLALYQENECQ